MKQLAATTAVILGVIGGVLTLWQMREALQLLLLAIVLSAGLEPTIRRLTARDMSRGLATGLTFGGMLISLVLGSLLFGALASAEISAGIEVIPRAYDSAARWLASQSGWQGELGAALPPTSTLVETLSGRQINDLGLIAVGLSAGVFTWMVLLLSVASLCFYWLLEQPAIERLWLSLLPLQARVPIRAGWKQIYAEIGLYVRQEVVVIVLTTVVLASLFSLLEVPGAVVLAILGGIAQVIPLIGLPLALIPATLVLATTDLAMAGILFGLALLSLAIIKGLIGPRLLRKGISTNPVLVILLILALAKLGGLASIVLAPPLAAAIQTCLRIFSSEQRSAGQNNVASEYTALSQQLDALEARNGDTPSLQLKSFVARTRSLLGRAMTKEEQS